MKRTLDIALNFSCMHVGVLSTHIKSQAWLYMPVIPGPGTHSQATLTQMTSFWILETLTQGPKAKNQRFFLALQHRCPHNCMHAPHKCVTDTDTNT